eukprot:2293964-Rhodomonas_salina.2
MVLKRRYGATRSIIDSLVLNGRYVLYQVLDDPVCRCSSDWSSSGCSAHEEYKRILFSWDCSGKSTTRVRDKSTLHVGHKPTGHTSTALRRTSERSSTARV